MSLAPEGPENHSSGRCSSAAATIWTVGQVAKVNLLSFPLPETWAEIDWASISSSIDASLASSATAKSIRTKRAHEARVIEYDEINGKSARDEILGADRALASIFSLTLVELDDIINYDIKYRMGLNGEEADTDE